MTALTLALGAGGCGTKSSPAPSTSSTRSAVSGAYTIVNQDDPSKTVAITITGTQIGIITGPPGARVILTGDMRNGKRKYASGQTPVAEVKTESPTEFKVRTPTGGAVLWKVKTGADKDKIYQGDATLRFQLKQASGTPAAWKVEDAAGTETGRVEEAPGLSKVKVKVGINTVFEVSGGPLTPAYGVLVCAGIPQNEQLIVTAELLAQVPR